MSDLLKQFFFLQILPIFSQEYPLHMTFSVFMYLSMISKDHEIFWNFQDLFSRCLERGDTSVRFSYSTTSEEFMVAEKWAKPFCISNFLNMVH